jgi:hypothetical protein
MDDFKTKDRAVDDGTVPGLPLASAQTRQPAAVLKHDSQHV